VEIIMCIETEYGDQCFRDQFRLDASGFDHCDCRFGEPHPR